MTENKNIGFIKVYSGGMFAGKTDAMISDLERAMYAKKTIICYKPAIDTRFGEDIVKSRSRTTTIKANVLPVEGTEEDVLAILEETKNVDVIGFDEVQFFGTWIEEVISKLRLAGKKVVANGLNMTFEGISFETTRRIMGIADQIEIFHAVCMCCGSDAIYSQKLINGLPAKGGSSVDIEDVSGKSDTTYEARCVNCFVPPERA